jgi:N-glycosylase/DNA lyase
MNTLPKNILDTYKKFENIIINRLNDFQNIEAGLIFYEFCFCIMTPQTSAKNAWQVQNKLIEKDFLNTKFNPKSILTDKKHYIRFHNTKSQRLLNAIDYKKRLDEILSSNINQYEKRNIIKSEFIGIGMKEASHFLRNIGYKKFAIIDRHILKMLYLCEVLNDTTPPKNDEQYLEIEQKIIDFSAKIDIDMDILDLLFFAHSNGEVMK